MNNLCATDSQTLLDSIQTMIATDYQKVWINEGPVPINPTAYNDLRDRFGLESVEGFYKPYPDLDFVFEPKKKSAKHVQPKHRIASPRGRA